LNAVIVKAQIVFSCNSIRLTLLMLGLSQLSDKSFGILGWYTLAEARYEEDLMQNATDYCILYYSIITVK